MINAILWDVVLTLHIIGIITWVGGGGFIVTVTRASVRALDAVQRHNVILAVLTRYFRILWPVMLLTLVTGWLLVTRIGRFSALPWPINAMQGAALLMAILFISCYFGPFRTARRAIRSKPKTLRAIYYRLILMIALGVVAIVAGVINSGI